MSDANPVIEVSSYSECLSKEKQKWACWQALKVWSRNRCLSSTRVPLVAPLRTHLAWPVFSLKAINVVYFIHTYKVLNAYRCGSYYRYAAWRTRRNAPCKKDGRIVERDRTYKAHGFRSDKVLLCHSHLDELQLNAGVYIVHFNHPPPPPLRGIIFSQN